MEKHFKKIFFSAIAVKLLLAFIFPITSDEAYFYTWIDDLSVNYYDHPPMTGWVVWLFSFLGDHIFFLRLFSVLSGALVSAGIYLYVKNIFLLPEKAALVSLAYIVAPLHMLFIPIATDSPLIVFVFLSGLSFYYGVRQSRTVFVFLSGFFLGLALLSKYFAALLLVAFFICLFLKRKRHPVKNSLTLLFGAMPFILLHIYWNSQNCWTNIMFNVINRNKNISIDFSDFISFLLFQTYLATPWLLYFIIKNLKKTAKEIKQGENLFVFLYAVPVIILAAVSFHSTGLHWTLSFYPFLFFLIVHLNRQTIEKIVKYSLIFSIVHLVIVFSILCLPVETARNSQYYHDFVLSIHGEEVWDKLADTYGTDYILATNGYYTSGALRYHSKKRCIVFLDYSKFGRHDDKLTDFKDLDGKDILIFATLDFKRDYSPFFDKIKIETLTVRENDFNILIGTGFKYNVYKALFLKKILEKWYAIPEFLPVGDCYFYNLYFPEKSCKTFTSNDQF